MTCHAAVVVAAGFVVTGLVAACEVATHSSQYDTAQQSTVNVGTSCGTGQTLCQADGGDADSGSGVCTDLLTDPANCGGCGNDCGSNFICTDGQCACPTTPVLETACGNACSDTTSDATNCGGCGKSCPSEHICVASQCVALCGDEETNCNNNCADLQSDPNNCAQCGHSCGALGCTGGECVTCAHAVCVNGDGGVGCYDLQISEEHCGSCTTACIGDQACVTGACECIEADKVLCQGVCITQGVKHCGPDCTDCTVAANKGKGVCGITGSCLAPVPPGLLTDGGSSVGTFQ